jgi:hypothetical protein
MRQRFGEEWGRDDEANIRYMIEAEAMLREIEGAHLIGDAELDEDEVTFTVWVDEPLEDLLSADELAYDIFARLSSEIFCAERQFESQAIRYPFVTGDAEEGHSGSLVLAGPHVADFADRRRLRLSGGLRYHA